jgi:hypothetical protein
MPEPPKLPPIASAPLSVILLAPDLAAPVESVVGAWSASLDKRGREYELILVISGSAERAAGLAERYPRIRVVACEGPGGEGAALRTGLAVAKHPLVFYTLCDPHFKPADLERLFSRRPDPNKPDLEIDQVHLMSGYRAGRAVPLPMRALGFLSRVLCRIVFCHWPERLPGWLGWRAHLGALAARAVFGVRYRDPACPFRLLRREILSRIPLQSDSPLIHVEILAKANFLGHVLGAELPLPAGHHPPVGSARQGGTFRQMAAEFRRLLASPDFGPPRQPEPPSAANSP